MRLSCPAGITFRIKSDCRPADRPERFLVRRARCLDCLETCSPLVWMLQVGHNAVLPKQAVAHLSNRGFCSARLLQGNPARELCEEGNIVIVPWPTNPTLIRTCPDCMRMIAKSEHQIGKILWARKNAHRFEHAASAVHRHSADFVAEVSDSKRVDGARCISEHGADCFQHFVLGISSEQESKSKNTICPQLLHQCLKMV